LETTISEDQVTVVCVKHYF